MNPGLAFVEGKFKPILAAREIRRGRNRGRYEVEVRKVLGSGIKTVKRIVEKESVRRLPANSTTEAQRA